MTLSGSYKARFAAGITDAISDTAGRIPSRSEQSFGTSLSRLVNVRENGCGRGCGTPAAAPLTRLEQEWHVS
jgi:sulfite reductase beta subunit-like hemoprotein